MKSYIARRVFNKLHKNGGFTYDVTYGQFIDSGFAISPYKQHETKFPADDITIADIQTFVRLHNVLLSQDRHFFGGWLDKRLAYLDISIIVDSLQFALHLAKQNNQIAVFDLATFTEYRVQDQPEKTAHVA